MEGRVYRVAGALTLTHSPRLVGRGRYGGAKRCFAKPRLRPVGRGGSSPLSLRESNRVRCQAARGFQAVPVLIMTFMMVKSFRMQATITTLGGL